MISQGMNKCKSKKVNNVDGNNQGQGQDTGKYRINTKDQFYTKVSVAKRCIEKMMDFAMANGIELAKYVWIEPSAGNGAFLHHIPPTFQKIGIDIDPKSPGICKSDYLEWVKTATAEMDMSDVIVFGNPPFGRQSSLAKAFIARSCEFAKIIAFILPKSFTKPSMNNAFRLDFHLIHSEELEKNSFVLNEDAYDVPCVFQIWQKRGTNRELVEKIPPCGFEYVKHDNYHIALRRVGANAGKSHKNDGKTEFSKQSHYFICFLHENVDAYVDNVIKKINCHVFPSNTVGPRSLSKSEINVVLNGIMEQMFAVIHTETETETEDS